MKLRKLLNSLLNTVNTPALGDPCRRQWNDVANLGNANLGIRCEDVTRGLHAAPDYQSTVYSRT